MNNNATRLILFFISLWFLGGPVTWGQGAFELADTQFQLEMAELEAKVDRGLAKLVKGYTSALSGLKQKYMMAGKLDETLLLGKEITRVETDTSVPDLAAAAIPPDILRYMKTYTTNYNKLMGVQSARQRVIIDSYVDTLEGLKVRLTRAGKIEEATRAKDEVERIQARYAALLSPAPAALGGNTTGARPVAPRPGPVAPSRGVVAFKARFPHLNGALQAYYSFDAGANASEVQDEVAPASDARVQGISYAEGQQGQAAVLAENGSLSLGTESPLHAMKVGAFSFWVKTRSASGVILSSYKRSTTRGFRVEITRKGCARFTLGGYNSSTWASTYSSYGKQNTRRTDRAESTDVVNDGEWHHVVAVKDGKKIYIYVDGSKGASSYSDRELMDENGDLRINGYVYSDYSDGSSSYSNYDSLEEGMIDEFMVFNRPLNEQEVKSIYSLQRL